MLILVQIRLLRLDYHSAALVQSTDMKINTNTAKTIAHKLSVQPLIFKLQLYMLVTRVRSSDNRSEL